MPVSATARLPGDAIYRARIEKRLGELYEAKNNSAKAIEHYETFVERWKGAGAELQPHVQEVRARLRLLGGGERSTR